MNIDLPQLCVYISLIERDVCIQVRTVAFQTQLAPLQHSLGKTGRRGLTRRIQMHLIVKYASDGTVVAMASHHIPAVRFLHRFEEPERCASQIHRYTWRPARPAKALPSVISWACISHSGIDCDCVQKGHQSSVRGCYGGYVS
jgi:hypothetical protein